MKEMVVLFPAPGMGHLTPMVELAKLFLLDGLAVTVLVVDPPFKQGSSDPFIAATSAAHPSLFFHHVPPVSLPPDSSPSSNPVTPLPLMFDTLRHATAHVRHLIKSLSENSTVRALVVDFFCTDSLEVANELGLPCYLFFPSGATPLAVQIYLPTLHSDREVEEDRNMNSFSHTKEEEKKAKGGRKLKFHNFLHPKLVEIHLFKYTTSHPFN